MVERHSEIVAESVLSHLTTPLLPQFLELARERDGDWANELLSRIGAVTDERVPAVWAIEVSESRAPALVERLSREAVGLGRLLAFPGQPDRRVPCVPLLLHRRSGAETILTPSDDMPLETGDHILFAGQTCAVSRIGRVLRHSPTLDLLLTGTERPQGWIWRRLRGESG
jgi:voltage-gated potassium channel